MVKAMEAARAAARKAVERTYEGSCNVIEYIPVTDEKTKITRCALYYLRKQPRRKLLCTFLQKVLVRFLKFEELLLKRFHICCEIVNPVEYASYVEYGHRQTPGRYVPELGKRLKKGWVRGKLMLTISEREIQALAPKVLEARLKKVLEGCAK